jgi:transcriptional regulator with XRE-family HTH domain
MDLHIGILEPVTNKFCGTAIKSMPDIVDAYAHLEGDRIQRLGTGVDQKARVAYSFGAKSTIMGASAMQFGETVRNLRIDLGRTQQEIAERTNARVSYISNPKYEKLHLGDYPSEKFIHRFAEALKADEDQLLLLADKLSAAMQMRVRQRPALFRRIAMMDNGALYALESPLT